MTTEQWMTNRRVAWRFGITLVFVGPQIPCGEAREVSHPVRAVQLTGLMGLKDNAKGTLSDENGNLHFVRGKTSSDMNATSIEDVFTGNDSQRAVGKTVGTISMAVPYGGGRFLSLFRTKLDTLAIKYRDADGGRHGAIFTMPAETADGIKKELPTEGAHTTVTGESTAPAVPPPVLCLPRSGSNETSFDSRYLAVGGCPVLRCVPGVRQEKRAHKNQGRGNSSEDDPI